MEGYSGQETKDPMKSTSTRFKMFINASLFQRRKHTVPPEHARVACDGRRTPVVLQLTAIELDDQHRVVAGEIGDVPIDLVRSAEFVACQVSIV